MNTDNAGEATSISGAGLFDKCVVCLSRLPLRLPEIGEAAQHWVCAGCGASYHAVLLDRAPPEVLRNVHPGITRSNRDELIRRAESPGAPPIQAGPHDLRRVSRVIPDHSSIRCDLETRVSRDLDANVKRGRLLRLHPRGKPFGHTIQRHNAVLPSLRLRQRFVDATNRWADQLSEMFRCFEAGGIGKLSITETISRQTLAQAAEDIDLFVTLGINPPPGEYPSRHSLHVSLLAMSIGVTLGWDQQTLLDIGIGCLIHDLGMRCLERSAYEHGRILSLDELAEIVKHPVMILELLQYQLERIPASSRMIAYQIHERCNGTGYPRKRSADQIHDLAKIAAVADVFVALVSPRPHRPAMIPYYGVKKILYDTKEGLYDAKVVRALLKTVSLFPLGSLVELNDGRQARVIRANGDHYDRPVIAVGQRDGFSSGSVVVDLCEHRELRVVRVLPHPDT